MTKILITGSAGMIGTATTAALIHKNIEVSGIDLDLKLNPYTQIADITNLDTINEKIDDTIDGIIHLAAVSRVIAAQKNPELCFRTNILGSNNVITAALNAKRKPWIIFASSREVYGDAAMLPVTEDMPTSPVNIYGKSKLAAEIAFDAARHAGLKTAIVRFSNVYGWEHDHVTRVIPAFLNAAIRNDNLYVEGGNNVFDFVHLSDAVAGLVRMVDYMIAEKTSPPTMHFVTGIGTSLYELANKITSIVGQGNIIQTPPRDFDVSKFYGNPQRSTFSLNWKANINLESGLKMFLNILQSEKQNALETLEKTA